MPAASTTQKLIGGLVSGCRFGNRAMQCEDLLEHRDCYKFDVRRDCCKTCKETEAKYFSG